MMKAFKTYELCPLNLKPNANIPNRWPWQLADISKDQTSWYIETGFTVMTEYEYENYLKSYQNEYDLWNETYSTEPKG